jgi:hypothetical protein
MTDDYYAILGVPETATLSEIKDRYWFLSKACHPNNFPKSEAKRRHAEEVQKHLNAAYEILGDPVKRARYDSTRSESSARTRPPEQDYSTAGRSYYETPHPEAENQSEYSPPPAPTRAYEEPTPASKPGIGGVLLIAALAFMTISLIRCAGGVVHSSRTLGALETRTPPPATPIPYNPREHFIVNPLSVETPTPQAPKTPALVYGLRPVNSDWMQLRSWTDFGFHQRPIPDAPRGAGIAIQLAYVNVQPTQIEIGFRVYSPRGTPEVLLYDPKEVTGNTLVPGTPVNERLFLLDDKGRKVYSTTGFIGGSQSPFNRLARAIKIPPSGVVSLSCWFPMMAKDATKIKFVSPEPDPLNQDEWWFEIPIFDSSSN